MENKTYTVSIIETGHPQLFCKFMQSTSPRDLAAQVESYLASEEAERRITIIRNDIHEMEKMAAEGSKGIAERYRIYKEDQALFGTIVILYFSGPIEMPADNTAQTYDGQAIKNILNEYKGESVCMAELLATQKVPAGMTFEQAFNTYMEAMAMTEGDKFIHQRSSGDSVEYSYEGGAFHEKNTEKTKLCVIFGERACREFSNQDPQDLLAEAEGKEPGELGKPMTVDEAKRYIEDIAEGELVIRSFGSSKEAEAYIMGVNESSGWLECYWQEKEEIDFSNKPDTERLI